MITILALKAAIITAPNRHELLQRPYTVTGAGGPVVPMPIWLRPVLRVVAEMRLLPMRHPQHYQTYQSDWPQNMVYPQQVPSGMVQYPYYTLRGPTDFFMK